MDADAWLRAAAALAEKIKEIDGNLLGLWERFNMLLAQGDTGECYQVVPEGRLTWHQEMARLAKAIAAAEAALRAAQSEALNARAAAKEAATLADTLDGLLAAAEAWAAQALSAEGAARRDFRDFVEGGGLPGLNGDAEAQLRSKYDAGDPSYMSWREKLALADAELEQLVRDLKVLEGAAEVAAWGFAYNGIAMAAAPKVEQLSIAPVSESAALSLGQAWVGPGSKEVARGVFRSANGRMQFRMTSRDLLGHGSAPVPHVHYEILGSRPVNYHAPLVAP
jgi:hypothetical protein